MFWIAVVVSYAWCPSWMEVLHLHFPAWLRYSGARAVVAAFSLLVLTMSARLVLWSPLPRLGEGYKLVTDGPYRFVRHPMYSAMTLLFVAFALVTANMAVTVSSLIAIVLTFKWGLLNNS